MKKNILFSFIVLFLLASCQNVDKKQSVNKPSAENLTLLNSDEELSEIYHRFPSPEEMLNVINKNEITFDETFLLPSNKHKKFLDSKTQALNIGVYGADLAYLTVFEKHKEAMKYFEAIYSLSDELRISSAFELSFLKRIENNLTNSDSLNALSEEAFINLTHHLESNKQEKIFALISFGGFIEALYLSFKITDDFSQTNPMVQRIADQKLVLENLISYSNEFIDDQAIASTLKMLNPIRGIYNELALETTETKVTKNEEGKLVISGGSKIVVSKEQFNQLKIETFRIRDLIIQK